mgnify:CR=1 FL=1
MGFSQTNSDLLICFIISDVSSSNKKRATEYSRLLSVHYFHDNNIIASFLKNLNTVVIPYIFVSHFSCHNNIIISYLKKKDMCS